MESFLIEDLSNCTIGIITFVLNSASTKLPLKEKDMINTLNQKGKSFNLALDHAKTALRDVCMKLNFYIKIDSLFFK